MEEEASYLAGPEASFISFSLFFFLCVLGLEDNRDS
jgi:hypothetical protein